MKWKDLTGNKIGKWQVLAYIRREIGQSKRGTRKIIRGIWKCRCECGKESLVESCNLGRVSLGCHACRTPRLPSGEAAFRRVIMNYKNAARHRGIDWALTDELARKLFSDRCFYCGSEPQTAYAATRCNGRFVYNGIDRVDNKIGYISSNCVTACEICNFMKGTMSPEKFLAHVRKISSHANR